MKRHLHCIALAALALTSSAFATDRAPRTNAAEERALGELRAGSVLAKPAVQDDERSALRQAEAQSPELGEMRGGLGLTEILLIVVIVLIIVILI